MALTITKVVCPENKYGIKCPYLLNPTRLVVHNTANDASAMSEISFMIGNDNERSFHYAVDDTRAVQGLPLNRNGWHAGDGNGKGNREGIAIEICYSKSGGDRFIAAENNAVELIVALLKQYNWGIDKVTKHQDYSGKYCPHRTLDIGWNRFLDKVQARFNEVNNVTVEVPPEKAPTSSPSQSVSNVSFHKGDKVKVIKAITSNGTPFTTYYDVYTVLSDQSNNTVVIGVGMTITARINITNIQKVTVSPVPSPKPITNTNVDVTYRVRVKGGKWYSEVKNLSDYAGLDNKLITGIAIKVSQGSITYSVHTKGGKWLGDISGYDISNPNKYAGYKPENETEIDAVKICYTTPSTIRPYKKAKYRVSCVGNTAYYDWQYDTETSNKQDGYAGAFGKSLDRLQIVIE